MIERYTRSEMGCIWGLENKFQKMLDVEKAVAQVQGEKGWIPLKAAQTIQKKAQFSLARIQKLEEKTKHDVIAFVENVAENVGVEGSYVHYGLTSSDVLDTSLSLLVGEAGDVLRESLIYFEKNLLKQIKKHRETLCAGRTHGMQAEPTTFGYKLLGYYTELQRNKERWEKALKQMAVGKLSGAVGTYSFFPPSFEKRVCALLKLKPEKVATQVIPRDRHCELLGALCFFGLGLERLSVEFRHLQRTEVGEVQEGFSKGQKGSSAMPHKKNPISSENLTGVARLLRGYYLTTQENVALWHERDISHSSVERVVFPDAFIICDYALRRMGHVLENLVVHKDQMRKNVEFSQGQLFTSHLLLYLIEKGLKRKTAYEHIQRISHTLKVGEYLKDKVLKDSQLRSYVQKKEVDDIFSGRSHQKSLSKVFEKVLKI